MEFSATVSRGEVPDYHGMGVDPALLREGLLYQSAAFSYASSISGELYAYFFPTLYYNGPDLPGLEFVMQSGGGFEISRVLHGTTMGNARDFSPLEMGGEIARFVVIDHGHEYHGSAEDWPFGHVWVAHDSGGGYEFQEISKFRAFNHSVDTGDLNGNGLKDILVSNMGEKEGGFLINLNVYLQQEDGSFELLDANASSSFSESGSGAAAIGDVSGNGKNGIVQANYGVVDPDWGAIRVFEYDDQGGYLLVDTVPRDGLFNSMGASRIVLADIDSDGDLDVVLSMEGAYPGDPLGGYTGSGLEIFENLGGGDFVRVTEDRLNKNVWRGDELSFRDFDMMDVSGDGEIDIILHPDSGFGDASGFSRRDYLSDFIFINDGEGRFQNLGAGSIEIFGLESLEGIKFLRAMDSYAGETDFFGMTTEGAPVHLTLRANLAQEHLANEGVTFDEVVQLERTPR